MPATEREAPSEAAQRMLASLGGLCPTLPPAPSPRGFPSDREHVSAICDTPAQRRELDEALAGSVGDGTCPVCEKHAVSAENAGLRCVWRPDFITMQWRLQSASAACVHCCAATSVDEMLRALLSVDDEGGEAAFRSLGRHSMSVNGMGGEDWEKLQAAVNIAHAVKTLASNMPFKVVDGSGAAATPAMFPALLVKALGGGGGAKRKGEKGSAVKAGAKGKRKSTGGAEEGARRRAVGDQKMARRSVA